MMITAKKRMRSGPPIATSTYLQTRTRTSRLIEATKVNLGVGENPKCSSGIWSLSRSHVERENFGNPLAEIVFTSLQLKRESTPSVGSGLVQGGALSLFRPNREICGNPSAEIISMTLPQ